jgi:GNAT superfamily N-acetyltransferase
MMKLKMITVKKLPVNRIGEAARLLARAFHDDPILTFFLNDPVRRKVAYPAFFRAAIYEAFECGYTYAAYADATEQRLTGVAVWIPPSGATPSRQFQRRADRNHAIVKSRFSRRGLALYRVLATLIELHPAEPHWYLSFVGVDPAFQGTGVGRKLTAPVLKIADRQGMPCYLETPFPKTHEFYRRQGFELGPATHPFKDAPNLWTMVRTPKR